MKFPTKSFQLLSSKFALLGTGSILTLASLAAVGTYAVMDAGYFSHIIDFGSFLKSDL